MPLRPTWFHRRTEMTVTMPPPGRPAMRRCGMRAKHADVPLRRVRAVEGAGRLFSTPSRPALRAACGRPPARQPHDGHRVAGLTLTRGDHTRRRTSAGHAAVLGAGQTHEQAD